MSMFTKPLSKLDTADLQELLTDGAVENARLEFKSEVPSKDETLKKLADSSDGRIHDLPGVDPVLGYKQKVVDWCFSGSAPPLVVEVSDPIPVPSGGGKVCYVIHLAESDVAPHFLNGRKGIWVRTDEFSSRFEARLAEENELRHLFDRRKLILERRDAIIARARKRFATLMSAKPRLCNSSGKIVDSRLELYVIPQFPSQPLCEHETLESTIRETWMSWRGVLFPAVDRGVISQHESGLILQAAGEDSIFEANIWGMLFYAYQVAETHQNNVFGIHMYQFVGNVLMSLKHADAMLSKLGYSGRLLVEVVLGPVLDVSWLDPSGGFISQRRGSLLDDEVQFSISTETEVLDTKTDRLTMDLLRYVLFAVNMPDLATQDRLEQLVRGGYTYNI